MKIKLFFSVVVFLGISMLSSCSDSDDFNKGKELEFSSETMATASQLENFYINFAKDAFKITDAKSEVECESVRNNNNVVVSPLSASFALGMLANGVDADMQSKLMKYLGVDDIYGLNELSKALIDGLPAVDGRSEFKISNAVWVSDKFNLNDDFSDIMKGIYRAPSQYIDFSETEKARTNINNWISSATKNIINDFLPILNPNTFFVLANAFHFESQWADEYFDKSRTVKEPFYGLNVNASEGVKDDMVSTVDMMHSSIIDVPYFKDEDFEFVSIPFGNKSFSFNILLPDFDLDFDKALEKLNKERYTDLVSKAHTQTIFIHMPKLDIDSKINIFQLLYSVGINLNNSMIEMFDDSSYDDISIMVRQNTVFTLDEEGVKLVSATVDNGALGAPMYYVMEVNRPYLFFITEKTTNVCLLAGRVLGF